MEKDTASTRAVTDRKHSADGLYAMTYALLEVCRQMLPLVRSGYGDTSEGERLVGAAEQVITRTECELQQQRAVPVRQRSGYFGRVGNHYDFEITLFKVLQRQKFSRLEGRDRPGRRIAVRLNIDEDSPAVRPGETVFFRGRVKSHRFLLGEPVTYIEATSQVFPH